MIHFIESEADLKKQISEKSDREIQELQLLQLLRIEKKTERIKLNVQFWFYLLIVSVALFVAFTIANSK